MTTVEHGAENRDSEEEDDMQRCFWISSTRLVVYIYFSKIVCVSASNTRTYTCLYKPTIAYWPSDLQTYKGYDDLYTTCCDLRQDIQEGVTYEPTIPM